MNIDTIKPIISESIEVKKRILEDEKLLQSMLSMVQYMSDTLKKGGKILFCGNGGSAADAQHLAAELSGRFYIDRKALAAEALHVNTSFITAVANDYGYNEVFARAVEAKGKQNDLLIALTTSGNSDNVVRAILKAKEMGMITIGLTGNDGGKIKTLCDLLIQTPSEVTPRIQEAHIMIGHIACELVEKHLFSTES